MSQDYHITRSEDWRNARGKEITDREWQSYAHNDPELDSDPANGPNAFVWKAHPDERPDAWLDWWGGNVYTVDPDESLVQKMVQVADALGARLVTDDNEVVQTDEVVEED